MGSNCYYCGKKLIGDEKVCPYCGRKQVVDEELVNAAKQGDQQAFTEIYMLSQQNVYLMVRSMVKDPDTVEDIVQDTFIKVYENLSSLNYEEGKFQAWVRRIAHNTTVNYVKKRKEVLFSEMEGDDSEGKVDFEDERGEHLPEVVIDQKETTRLIDEMLDTLTEDQRLVVGMYYYEQKSVNEIAETLGISVNTVKSRMSYGRKKVEMQVRALEKQGTKLYGLSPIPFLMLLFRNQETQAAAPDAATAEKAVGAIMAAKTALEAAGQGGAAAAQSVATAQTSAAAGSGGTAASTAAQSSATASQGAAASQSAAGSQAASHSATAAGNTASSAGKAATATGKATATAGKTTAALGKSIAIKATAGVLAVGLAGGAVFYASNRKPEEEIGTETEIVLATETEEPTEVIEVETETETESETESEIVVKDGIMLSDSQLGDENHEYVWRSSISRFSVQSITFYDTLDAISDGAWDVSQDEDGSVMAWVEQNENDMYDLYVAAEGGVVANEDCSYLFDDYSYAESINFNHSFRTENVTNMEGMFASCSYLTELDLSDFQTGNVTNMAYMFIWCFSLTELDVSMFDTSQVLFMGGMFQSCTALTRLDLSGFDTSALVTMGWMFAECYALEEIDLSGFDTSNVINMDWLFDECYSLTEIDVSGFDTSNVTNMNAMFGYCTSITYLDLSHFDTSNVTDMGGMFQGCISLQSIDLSHFDTSNVTTMRLMFAECKALQSLDVSHFDTSNVTDMGGMFELCEALQTLDTSGFDMTNVTDTTDMFVGTKWE